MQQAPKEQDKAQQDQQQKDQQQEKKDNNIGQCGFECASQEMPLEFH